MMILSSPPQKEYQYKIAACLVLLLLALSSRAANPPDVVINEIAWMGTEISHNDEWIELYNNTDENINLDGWILKTADDELEIKLEGTILSKDFFLLERTDDTTLSDFLADLIYTGSLNNGGENLELYNYKEELIDFLEFSDSWPAGDNKTKQTMERINLDSWQTSLNSGGTPRAVNSPRPTKTEQLIDNKLPDELKISPSGIVINEILPSPEGADAENEWIELSNQSDLELNLADCQIRDVVGVVKTYTFPKKTMISPRGYLVFFRPTTKITFNNSGDSLELIGLNGEILDTITYGKAPLGESFNRTDTGWLWSKDLSPGENNMMSANMVGLKEELPDFVLGETKKIKEERKQLASLGEQISDNNFSFSACFTALILAIFSALIIFIIKKKTKMS